MNTWPDLDPALLEQLRALAASLLKRSSIKTLSAGDFVNEAMARVFGGAGRQSLRQRDDILRYCARAVRNVIVDYERQRGTQKNNEGVRPQSLDALLEEPGDLGRSAGVLAIDEALGRMEDRHGAEAARICETFLFLGLSEREVAAHFEVSRHRVHGALSLFRALMDGDRVEP